jgi:hypothetical protein
METLLLGSPTYLEQPHWRPGVLNVGVLKSVYVLILLDILSWTDEFKFQTIEILIELAYCFLKSFVKIAIIRSAVVSPKAGGKNASSDRTVSHVARSHTRGALLASMVLRRLMSVNSCWRFVSVRQVYVCSRVLAHWLCCVICPSFTIACLNLLALEFGI